MLTIELGMFSIFGTYSTFSFTYMSCWLSILIATTNQIPLKYKIVHFCYVGLTQSTSVSEQIAIPVPYNSTAIGIPNRLYWCKILAQREMILVALQVVPCN